MRNIQQSGNLYGKWITLKQISKRTARKLYASGEEVCLQSCNMMPFGAWQNACPITPDQTHVDEVDKPHYDFCVENGYPLPVHEPTLAGQFDATCNEFYYYNCDNERGRYISFYQKIQE